MTPIVSKSLYDAMLDIIRENNHQIKYTTTKFNKKYTPPFHLEKVRPTSGWHRYGYYRNISFTYPKNAKDIIPALQRFIRGSSTIYVQGHKSYEQYCEFLDEMVAVTENKDRSFDVDTVHMSKGKMQYKIQISQKPYRDFTIIQDLHKVFSIMNFENPFENDEYILSSGFLKKMKDIEYNINNGVVPKPQYQEYTTIWCKNDDVVFRFIQNITLLNTSTYVKKIAKYAKNTD